MSTRPTTSPRATGATGRSRSTDHLQGRSHVRPFLLRRPHAEACRSQRECSAHDTQPVQSLVLMGSSLARFARRDSPRHWPIRHWSAIQPVHWSATHRSNDRSGLDVSQIAIDGRRGRTLEPCGGQGVRVNALEETAVQKPTLHARSAGINDARAAVARRRASSSGAEGRRLILSRPPAAGAHRGSSRRSATATAWRCGAGNRSRELRRGIKEGDERRDFVVSPIDAAFGRGHALPFMSRSVPSAGGSSASEEANLGAGRYHHGPRACSSADRASASGAEGRRFESSGRATATVSGSASANSCA